MIEVSTDTSCLYTGAASVHPSRCGRRYMVAAGGREEASVCRRSPGPSVNRAGRAAAQCDALITRLAASGRSVGCARRTRPVGRSVSLSIQSRRGDCCRRRRHRAAIGHDRLGRAGGPVGRSVACNFTTGGRSSARACNMPSVSAITVRCGCRHYCCCCCDAEACCCGCTAAVFAGHPSVCPAGLLAVECSAWLRSQINCRVVSALRLLQSDCDNVRNGMSSR